MDQAEIKKAYRKLALKLHPDKNQSPYAEEAFKAVSEAEATLSNPVRRKKYDLLLREGGDGRGSSLNFGAPRAPRALPPALDLSPASHGAASGVDDDDEDGPTVVEAWRQASSYSDFVLFVVLQALKLVVVNAGAILYVVVLLGRAVFYEKLSGGQRTVVCVLLAMSSLLLSIWRDSFGTMVAVGSCVMLLVLTLLANGSVFGAGGVAAFGPPCPCPCPCARPTLALWPTAPGLVRCRCDVLSVGRRACAVPRRVGPRLDGARHRAAHAPRCPRGPGERGRVREPSATHAGAGGGGGTGAEWEGEGRR